MLEDFLSSAVLSAANYVGELREPARGLGEDEITTQREFEQAFRDKVAARSSGGGAEQMKQFKLFDEAGKGFVNFDDLMRAAKRWNLCASDLSRPQHAQAVS